MEILGYGEDSLTYWCLTNRLSDVLTPFGDSIENTLVVFYRPSFGRRSNGSAATPEVRGPQFGEFDGIVVTKRGVYLIEAKWTNSGEIDTGLITLRPEQLRRHQLFRAYLEAWRAQNPVDWKVFVTDRPLFELRALDGTVESFNTARAESLLATNLATVLKRCAEGGEAVEDVLLVVHPMADVVSEKRNGPKGFTVIELPCPDMKDGYVVLSRV
jgi:hypothetical protein